MTLEDIYYEEADTRKQALGLALDFLDDKDPSSDTVVAVAKQFTAFLLGETVA